MTDYADAGVNNDLKRDASKILYEASKKTWANRAGRFGEIIGAYDDFSAPRCIDISGLLPGTVCSLGFDGVGTKMELGERLNKHDTVAFDLFAMVCDDAVVRGAEPAVVGTILDVKTLKKGKDEFYLEQLDQLATGYVAAAKAARVAVINGEIAELGARVNGHGSFNYNWGAGVLWVANKDRMLTGNEIHPGDNIVALREYGFRSNGLSLVRKILSTQFGQDYHTVENGRYAAAALLPSTIYSAAVCDMFGGAFGEPKAALSGVAHITGGGIPEKLGRVLQPSGFGAVLDTLFEPPEIMQELQRMGTVTDEDAYKTWNMGNGMLIITPEPGDVIACAKAHSLDAKLAGEVTAEPGIDIRTRAGKMLPF